MPGQDRRPGQSPNRPPGGSPANRAYRRRGLDNDDELESHVGAESDAA